MVVRQECQEVEEGRRAMATICSSSTGASLTLGDPALPTNTLETRPSTKPSSHLEARKQESSAIKSSKLAASLTSRWLAGIAQVSARASETKKTTRPSSLQKTRTTGAKSSGLESLESSQEWRGGFHQLESGEGGGAMWGAFMP